MEPELLGLFLVPIEALGLPHAITGSVASIAYGRPRLTHDVDQRGLQTEWQAALDIVDG